MNLARTIRGVAKGAFSSSSWPVAADASGAVAGTVPAAAVGQWQQPAAAAAVAGTSEDAGISPVAETEDSWLLVSETRLTDTSSETGSLPIF